MSDEEIVGGFTITPRYIPSDVRGGKMAIPEWRVYQWIRSNANPFGIAIVNIQGIRDDIFTGATVNYINQLLISLRTKRYIWYKPRAGRRGSFEVHFNDWIMPGGQIKHLDYLFDETEVRGMAVDDIEQSSEVGGTNALPSKSLDEENSIHSKDSLAESFTTVVRASYTDTQNENETDTNATFKGRMRTRDFIPRTDIEELVHEVAIAVGDEYINPILSFVRKHPNGDTILRQIFQHFKMRAPKVDVENPAAFFQGLLTHYDRYKAI